MRKIISVTGNRFNIFEYSDQIAEICNLFTAYLLEYPAKGISKHAIMGPVAKILERAKTNKWDADALLGFAVRIHEMNSKTNGFISEVARSNLENGTKKLIHLCREVPLSSVDKVVEQLDHQIYYARRKYTLERLEEVRKKFISWLEAKYGEPGNLSEAWQEKINLFSEIRYPSQKNEAYQKCKLTKKEDIDAFWIQIINNQTVIDEIIEEEE